MRAKTTHFSHKNPVGRPRDPDIDARVLRAATALLVEHGYAAFSMAKVAKRSGIARQTIKLRWASKDDILITLTTHLLDDRVEVKRAPLGENVSARDIILLVLEDMIELLRDAAMRRIFASIIAAASYSEPMGALRQYIAQRRGIVLRELLERGIKTGEFRKDLNIEIAMDALIGPIQYRLITIGAPMETDEAEDIVNMVLGPPKPKT